jgi:hypothetical protein
MQLQTQFPGPFGVREMLSAKKKPPILLVLAVVMHNTSGVQRGSIAS